MPELTDRLELQINHAVRAHARIGVVTGLGGQLQLAEDSGYLFACQQSTVPILREEQQVVGVAEIVDAGNSCDRAIKAR